MTRPSFRVYFVPHGEGFRTGILVRRWETPFDGPPPSAVGSSEEDVYRQLETLLREGEAAGKDHPSRYLWEGEFEVRMVTVDVHPQTTIAKRPVIGKKEVPLKLYYAATALEKGGYRVMLPRFDWWFVLENLDLARDVLRSAIGTSLLGEQAKSMFDFRSSGDEYVRAWEPELLLKVGAGRESLEVQDDFAELRAVSEEWVEKAFKGRLPPVLGLDPILDAHAPLLTREPRPSLLVVGEAGVGKTSLVRRLARRFAAAKRGGNTAQVPRIWATSGQRIIAGMIYLGMWQERCLKLVSELSHEGDYLYVDRLTAFLAEQPDGTSIAEVMLAAVTSGEVSLIAECTEAELERARKRLPALVNSFQIIRVPETAQSAMAPLLLQAQARKNPEVSLHPQAMKRLVQHLASFKRDVRFPGKGFQFLDWLLAEQSGGSGGPSTLYPRDVSELYAKYSGLPVELISDEYPVSREKIMGELTRGVIGQDEACRVSAAVIARMKAGLNDPERPIGGLLFVGPTGVGKTELAKQLARYLFGSEERMIRLDMSEYMSPGAAARLLDASPGSRSLAERVRETPLALVLLDEIEKAHPEVFDLLLGMLGEGRLTDDLGRLVDFRMVLFVMTSNLGAQSSAAMGFGEAPEPDYSRSVRDHFRPELFNRLDHVVSFRALSQDDILKIVDLVIAGLAERTGLLRRNLRLDVAPKARQILAKEGYHPTRGARPLRRLVEEKVVTPVAVRMAADPEFRDRVVPVLARASQAYLRLSEAERREVVVVDE